MSGDGARLIGGHMVLGIRGARAGDPLLEEDLDACASVGAAGVILFDRDVATGGGRNVESVAQVTDLCAFVRERLGAGTLVCVDQEGGRVRRLREGHGFLAWPAAADTGADAELDRRVAELASCGIDVNFAPCVDVDVNPDSPVIGRLGRSYSPDAEIVRRAAQRVARAHPTGGVACFYKHFPGHGSATTDSHTDLTDITPTWQRERELLPYRDLARAPARVGVMTGHLLHRALDPVYPASLSHAITTGLLRDRLGFRGVVATDSLDMEGVRARWSLAESVALALCAGADLVVHACNSRRGEHAPDVVRALERVVVDDGLSTMIAVSGVRLNALHSAGAEPG